MLIFYLILFSSLFFGLSIKSEGFYEDCLERKQTDAVKGLFIWMVFLSHAMLDVRASGFEPTSIWDISGFRFRAELGQLVVAPFLFYSGFGVMSAFKNKGKEYLARFPYHRMLNTLLNFDIAVLVFVALNITMGVHMDLKQVGWSLIGWRSIGIDSWYIFVILICYLASWISGKLFPDGGWRIATMTTSLILFGEAVLSFLKHGAPWWYNTMLCYPAGMFLSVYKNEILEFVKRCYVPILCVLLTVFLFLHFQRWIPALRGLTFNAKSIAFVLLIVLITMKVKTNNLFLNWSGACVFPIFIYQRLPMRALRHWAGDAWVCANHYVFIMLSLLVTWGIAYCYKHWRFTFYVK